MRLDRSSSGRAAAGNACREAATRGGLLRVVNIGRSAVIDCFRAREDCSRTRRVVELPTPGS
jgi:hypothetical protein